MCLFYIAFPNAALGWCWRGGGGKHTLTRAHMQIKAINSLWWSETSRRKQSVPLPWKPLSPRRAERDGKTQRANEMGREWQKNSHRQTDGHSRFYTSAFPWKAGVLNIMFKGILWLVEEGAVISWSFAAGDGRKFANYRSHIVPHRWAVTKLNIVTAFTNVKGFAFVSPANTIDVFSFPMFESYIESKISVFCSDICLHLLWSFITHQGWILTSWQTSIWYSKIHEYYHMCLKA